jgi:large subunit ribosomal protein L11
MENRTEKMIKIATLSRADLEEIANMQRQYMNTDDIEAIIRTIAGTAKNMGIDIEKGAIKMAA